MKRSAFIRRRVNALGLALLITGLSLAKTNVSAAEEGEGKALDPLCPDAEVWSGKLITDICWGCLFPIRIAGGAWGDGEVPDGVTDKILCACDSPTGIPELGLTLGLWSPARLIEIVRNPWCAPALGGAVLNESAVSRLRLLGTAGHAEYDASETSFYNYHYYAFPLYILLDLFWDDRCNADGYRDFDLLYVSELDPTWSNDELAFFTNPEAVLFANPIAVAACAVDGVAATAGHPIDEMFWCAGTWGHLYPLSGVAYTSAGTDLRISSLLATRATAALHRRGLAWKTVGNDALCGGNIYPFMPKNQYRMSLFYPVAETDRTHAIGESTYRWGSGKTYPGPGEDHVYLLWRWQDCCAGI